MGRQKGIEVILERTKIPADGQSPAKIFLRFTENPGAEVELKLTRRGSFSSEQTVRLAKFAVVNNEVELKVYPPRRPGTGTLRGPGFKQRLEFTATSIWQAIAFDWIPTLVIALSLALLLKTFVIANFYIPSGSMEPTLYKNDFLIADKLSYKVLGAEPHRGDVMIFKFPEDRKVDYIKRIIGLPGDKVRVSQGVVYVNGVALDEDYIKEAPRTPFAEITVPVAGPPQIYYTSAQFTLGDKPLESMTASMLFDSLNNKSYDGTLVFSSALGSGGTSLQGELELRGQPDYCFPLELGLYLAGADTPVAEEQYDLLPLGKTMRISSWELPFHFRDLDPGDYVLRLSQTPRDSYFAMGDNRNNSQDSRVWGFVPRDYLEGRALFVFLPVSHAQVLAREETVLAESAHAADGE